MAVDNNNLKQLEKTYRNLSEGEIQEFMEQCAVGEGVYTVKQAKLICKTDKPDIVNAGHYRVNFHCGSQAQKFKGNGEHDGSPPRRSGTNYAIDVYNNLDYAGPLEYGFRSHFVPGHWEGRSFVHNRNDPAGGMYVGKPGGFVRGHHTLDRALKTTLKSQETRLSRKLLDFLNEKAK